MKVTLETAGSSLEKVVKTTIFVIDPAAMEDVNDVYRREYFTADYPARGFVAVKAWPYNFDIEIECIDVA